MVVGRVERHPGDRADLGGRPAAQAAVARVLPQPAPALTRVSVPRVPASSSASTFGRTTKPGGRRGRASLVLSRLEPGPGRAWRTRHCRRILNPLPHPSLPRLGPYAPEAAA